MSRILLKSLLISPAVLGAALVASAPAMAKDAKSLEEVVQASAQTSVVAPQQTAAVAPEVTADAVAPVADELKLETQAQPTTVAELAPVQQPVTVAQSLPAANDTAESTTLDQINRYSREGRKTGIDQVTSVSQFSDVRPTDWAFQALQSLVERYGCIVGYPDRTYRGNRAMTRYEFAAGLNACLDRVQELIAAGTADLVRKEDLEALKKLQEDFAAELATLRGRVDALEARTSTLEKQQFSTTTKLAGEVIFAVTDEFGQPGNNETVFQDRVRLVLNTSFSGRDLLVTRLAAGNATRFNEFGARDPLTGSRLLGPTSAGTQTFNVGNTGGNDVVVDWLAYYFPVGDNIQFYVPAFGGLHYDYVPTNSGLMEAFDGGTGPLSVFAQRNPIYNIGGGTGAAVNFGFGGPFKVSLGYLADNTTVGAATGASSPVTGGGLFNGSYSALAQLTFAPSDSFSLGLTYVNAFRKAGVGAGPTSSLFDLGGGAPSVVGSGLDAVPTTLTGARGAQVNAYGVSAAFKFSPTMSINGYFSYIDADFLSDGLGAGEYWTYGLGLAFADFGKRGNLLGISAGVQPYLGNSRTFGIRSNDEPIHLELFYKYQLTDNISITPGVIWVINPAQGFRSSGDDLIIGTLRTTFTF